MKNFITTNMLNEIDNKAVENLEKLNLRVEDLTLEQVFKFANRFDLAKAVAKEYFSEVQMVELDLMELDLVELKKEAIEKVAFLMEYIGRGENLLEDTLNSTIEDWMRE
ncbi:hypothetical protein ACNSOL_11765 (plasmid) [Aliarcobacter lanthieri]|uniref:hypothetical protein n=1 Tax=Aliarcobacter lanthieri TaxID=1355374 RepID=UPI003AAEEA75